MSTFLLIVLGLAVAIVLVLAGVRIWLRRKIRSAVGDYQLIAPYLIAPAARISLRTEAVATEPDGGDDAHARAMHELRAMVLRMEAQGFVHLGAFAADEDGRVLIAAQHRESGVVGQAIYLAGSAPYLECMTLTPSGQVRVISGELDARPLQLPSLVVQTNPGLSPSEALKALAATPGRALDLPTFVMLVERVHAARMDSALVKAPTAADMQAHADSHGGAALTAVQHARALDMNRESWADAVRVALLDNGRRKLKLDSAAWGRLEREIVVVHEAMTEDEAIATLAEHNLVDTLGEQLKRQNFTPVQIFDEINQRLGPDDQRALAVKVRFPVRARLFARPAALRAAGLTALEEAA